MFGSSIAYGCGHGCRYSHLCEKVNSKGGPATRSSGSQVCNGRSSFCRGISSGLFTPALRSNRSLKCSGQTRYILYATNDPAINGPGYEACNFRACDNRGGCILTSIIPRNHRNGIDIWCGRNSTGRYLTNSGLAVLKCFSQSSKCLTRIPKNLSKNENSKVTKGRRYIGSLSYNRRSECHQAVLFPTALG